MLLFELSATTARMTRMTQLSSLLSGAAWRRSRNKKLASEIGKPDGSLKHVSAGTEDFELCKRLSITDILNQFGLGSQLPEVLEEAKISACSRSKSFLRPWKAASQLSLKLLCTAT